MDSTDTAPKTILPKETRRITVDGGFSADVLLVRRDKRGALVQVTESWCVYKGKYRSRGSRFYVPVNQARRVK